MQIITVTAFKGGCGKSTLAAHLAVELQRLGYGPIALIDTDPQGSLSDWWSLRQAVEPRFAWVNAPQLAAYLDFLPADGITLTLLDTPPALESIITAAIAVCDLAVVPVRPSPNDLQAVMATVERLAKAGKDFLFVLNAATPRSNIVRTAMQTLAQYGQVAPIILHNRIDVAVSMSDGRTAGEHKRTSKSAQEITALAAYIHGNLAAGAGPQGRAKGERFPASKL